MADDKTEMLPQVDESEFTHCEKHDFKHKKGTECPKCQDEKGG